MIPTLSLHDALPISFPRHSQPHLSLLRVLEMEGVDDARIHFVSSIAASQQLIEEGLAVGALPERSEEHTSELQSRGHLVCRLLLEKKKLSEYICDV